MRTVTRTSTGKNKLLGTPRTGTTLGKIGDWAGSRRHCYGVLVGKGECEFNRGFKCMTTIIITVLNLIVLRMFLLVGYDLWLGIIVT